MNYSQSVEIRFGLPGQGRGAPFIQTAGPDGPFKAKYADRSDFVGREATQDASNKATSNQSNSKIMGTNLYIHLKPPVPSMKNAPQYEQLAQPKLVEFCSKRILN